MFFPPFSGSVLMAENRRHEKFAWKQKSNPRKPTKYATSATNLQMGPYVISKRSQIRGFACIHLGWSPARRRAAQPPLLPGDIGATKHREAASRAPTFLVGRFPISLWRALPIPGLQCQSRERMGWGGFFRSNWELTTHRSGHS